MRFILAICCKDDFYHLGVRVTPTGLLVPIRENPKDTEQNNGDGVDGITEGDGSVRDFNESDNEKDNRDKVSNYIKMVLSTFTDGTDDILGLPKALNIGKAIDMLHSLCYRCDSVDEMIEALKLKGEKGWIEKLANALSLDNNTGFIDGMTMSNAEKEILREQFFKSMNLHFTSMATTVVSKKGDILTFTPNVNSVAYKLGIKTAANYKLGSAGIIYGGYVHRDEANQILEELMKISRNNWPSDDVQTIYEALRFIGVDAGKKAIRNANEEQLANYVRRAYVAMSKYGNAEALKKVYSQYTYGIIRIIGEGTPDKKRVMARVNNKKFYSWLVDTN